MTPIKNALDTKIQELRTLRDEIRLQLHLAGQEARERWERHLEPVIDRLELQFRHVTEATADSLHAAIERASVAIGEFRRQLSAAHDDDDDEPDFSSIPQESRPH